MRYLKYNQDFLNNEFEVENIKVTATNNLIGSSQMILELLENDITWGGSLLGRLINSSIRMATKYYKLTRVESVVSAVKNQLDSMVSDYMDESDKVKYSEIKFRFLMEELLKVVDSKDAIEDKIQKLLGVNKSNSGLIDVTIESVKSIEINGKDLIINALSNFKKDIESIKITHGKEKDVSKEKEEPDTISNLIKNALVILEKILNRHKNDKTSKLTVELAGAPQDFKNISKENDSNNKEDKPSAGIKNIKYKNESLSLFIHQIDKIISAGYNKAISEIKSSDDIKLYKEIFLGKPNGVLHLVRKSDRSLLEDLNLNVSKKTEVCRKIAEFSIVSLRLEKENKLDKIDPNDAKDVKEFNSFLKGIWKTYSQDQRKAAESNKKINEIITSYNRFFSINEDEDINKKVDITNADEVKKAWDKNFREEEYKNWRVNEDDAKKMEEYFENKKWTFDLVNKPDPIIKIVELFGKAHNLYYTVSIPSGRPNGRISQRTFREYISLGKDSTWEKDSSPRGPFASRIVLEKWRNGIMKLLEDKKYRKIFSNIKFRVKGTKVNAEGKLENLQYIKETDEVANPNQPQGQILFKFMNAMLDDSTLGDYDHERRKLLADYFGITDPNLSPLSSNLSTPNKRDIQPNFANWQDKEKSNKLPINDLIGKFFSIDLEAIGGQKHDRIIGYGMKMIRSESTNTEAAGQNGLLIKFQFDCQEFADQYASEQNPKLTVERISRFEKGTIYYGLIGNKDIKKGSSITLSYYSVYGVGNTPSNELLRSEFKIKGRDIADKAKNLVIHPIMTLYKYAEDKTINEITLPSPIKDISLGQKTFDQITIKNEKLIDCLKKKLKDNNYKP